jgi:hypothetical protein
MNMQLLLISIISFSLSCCNSNIANRKELITTNDTLIKMSTSDSSYQKRIILDTIANFLNESIPGYKQVNKIGFYVSDENRCGGFFVYDLTDTLNNSILKRDSFTFTNNHVYHFASTSMPWSISNILILENGHMKIFKAINCEDKGDKISDVLNYVLNKPSLQSGNKGIDDRIKNFRNYGRYIMTDIHSSLNCDYYNP